MLPRVFSFLRIEGFGLANLKPLMRSVRRRKMRDMGTQHGSRYRFGKLHPSETKLV